MKHEAFKRSLVEALRAHLDDGKKPRLPEGGVAFWNLFMSMGQTRTYHSAGPNAISFAEIEAWCRLHRVPLMPHHIAIIRAMDDAWLAFSLSRRERREAGDRRQAPIVSKRELSANVFDGMFG